MGWKEWGLVTLVGGQIGHSDAHPLDVPKHQHIHVELEYTHVGTTGNIIIPGRRNFTIIPATGELLFGVEMDVGSRS